jgi:hypothetical protein
MDFLDSIAARKKAGQTRSPPVMRHLFAPSLIKAEQRRSNSSSLTSRFGRKSILSDVQLTQRKSRRSVAENSDIGDCPAEWIDEWLEMKVMGSSKRFFDDDHIRT